MSRGTEVIPAVWRVAGDPGAQTRRKRRKRGVRVGAAAVATVPVLPPPPFREETAGGAGAGSCGGVWRGVASAPRRPGRAAAIRGRWPNPQETAAVAISLPEGTSYAEALRKARVEIPLGDLGIEPAFVRRSAIGGLLIGVAGSGSPVARADTLALRLRESLLKQKKWYSYLLKKQYMIRYPYCTMRDSP